MVRGILLAGVCLISHGFTYAFYLRDDAKWSNSDAVTAGDFVFSFRRLMSPKTDAGYASIFSSVKNAAQIATCHMNINQRRVKALYDKTLQIALNAPTPYFC